MIPLVYLLVCILVIALLIHLEVPRKLVYLPLIIYGIIAALGWRRDLKKEKKTPGEKLKEADRDKGTEKL